jgi:hypothetical protein
MPFLFTLDYLAENSVMSVPVSRIRTELFALLITNPT